ncbi:MAG: VWA domain-containing protein [Methanotrichaceae archaeon]|nr:VWA domain-containing protein [Methanotrichaceae archaeon]
MKNIRRSSSKSVGLRQRLLESKSSVDLDNDLINKKTSGRKMGTKIIIGLPIIMICLISCAFSQIISIDPALPERASNNGMGIVSIEWNYPYDKYTVKDYDLVIYFLGADGKSKKEFFSKPYNVGDEDKGQHSPLIGKYVWNVPKDQTEGYYQAELRINTEETGEVSGGAYWPFGVARITGSLHIFKFEDFNGDGTLDTGEKGLSGWEFKITTPENQDYSRITASDGWIRLDKLPVGEYRITEIVQPGYKATTQNPQQVTVSKDTVSAVEFGNKPLPTTLQIVKFHDFDRDGSQDENEPPLSGWEFSVQGPSSFTETTDSMGVIVKEVIPGSYTVREKPKSTEEWSATTPIEQTVTLKKGETRELKFGNWGIPPAKLTVINFEDLNGNGVYDPEEKGLPNWDFSIEGKESFKDRTGPDGSITHVVKSGTYTAKETLNPGWISTTRAEQSAILASGEEKTLYFGNRGPQLIYKFEDSNANKALDPGERGLAGWTFDIKGPVTTIRTTDFNGQININDLPAGKYVVTERQTDPSYYSTTSASLNVTVPGPSVYFGNDRYRTLKVFKFNDINRNEVYDQNESGLANFEFQVSGVADPNLTDSKGVTTFKVKANRKYIVSESLRVGWLNSTPLVVEVLIDPGKDVTEVLFGDYRYPDLIIEPTKTVIAVHAFNDSNHNGELDASESGLPNREIRISDINDTSSTYESIVTDKNGDAEFICPSAGTYWVEQVLPSDWCSNGDIAKDVMVQEGGRANENFGSYPCIFDNCSYRYKPPWRAITLSLEDENLVVKKTVNPYVLSMADHDMVKGTLINYTITVCAKPKIGPTDLVLAIDTSGSVIEDNKAALTDISRGISGFVESMKKSQNANLRIGLVSWDRDIDEIVKPTLNYDDVANASTRLSANFQELTMYHVGMNGSLAAFDAAPREDARKVIVFVTDARNEYEPFLGMPDPAKYTVYVLLMGPPQVGETYEMLIDSANRNNGRLIKVNSSSEIASALRSLTQTSLVATGSVNDIKVVDTLPSYLRPMNNGTKPGIIIKNSDGVEWKTTSLAWSIPSLQYGDCWSTTFSTVFCWKLQANVFTPDDSTKATSQVDYADPDKAGRRVVRLPEGTIWILSAKETEKEEPSAPGIGALAGLVGLIGAACILRRRSGER